MERGRKLGRLELGVEYENHRGTHHRRRGVVHGVVQQSGMGYRAGGAGMVGDFGIIGVDVDRLDCAGEDHQQHAQRA